MKRIFFRSAPSFSFQTKNAIAAAERRARLEVEDKLARVTVKSAEDMAHQQANTVGCFHTPHLLERPHHCCSQSLFFVSRFRNDGVIVCLVEKVKVAVVALTQLSSVE